MVCCPVFLAGFDAVILNTVQTLCGHLKGVQCTSVRCTSVEYTDVRCTEVGSTSVKCTNVHLSRTFVPRPPVQCTNDQENKCSVKQTAPLYKRTGEGCCTDVNCLCDGSNHHAADDWAPVQCIGTLYIRPCRRGPPFSSLDSCTGPSGERSMLNA